MIISDYSETCFQVSVFYIIKNIAYLVNHIKTGRSFDRP